MNHFLASQTSFHKVLRIDDVQKAVVKNNQLPHKLICNTDVSQKLQNFSSIL